MSSNHEYSLSGAQLWPTMLFSRHWEAHAREVDNILGHVRQLKAEQQTRIASGIAVSAKSATGLFESDFDLFRSSNPSLRKLVTFIDTSLATAVCIANRNEFQPHELQIQFVDSWYHVTNDGGFHDAHVHHGCSWCGIYYLSKGETSVVKDGGAPNGGSRFYCPFNVGGGYRDVGNKYLTASVDIPIEDGLLVMFPSYLLHSGLPYRGSTDRIVLAFNARIHLKSPK